MLRITAGIVAAGMALSALFIAPAGAQRAGESWQSLIPGLKSQLAATSDPEVALRLALVYAHEGQLIDWWHSLKQIDRMTGGEGHRRAGGPPTPCPAPGGGPREPTTTPGPPPGGRAPAVV